MEPGRKDIAGAMASQRDPFQPKAHLAALQSLLPAKYSPLRSSGDANVTYLSAIGEAFGRFVVEQMGWAEASLPLAAGAIDAYVLSQRIEHERLDEILSDVGDTERESVRKSRTKQGLYRDGLQSIEASCRVTGVDDPSLLIASHAKPWAVCSNAERVDPHNGLMLAPHVDYLFDRGLMKFYDDGNWSYSPRLSADLIGKMGLPSTPANVRPFKPKQLPYISYHRATIFKGPLS